MIHLTKDDLQVSRCSLVPDEQLMTKLARALAQDAESKRLELVQQSVKQRILRTPTQDEIDAHFDERSEDGRLIWVCWKGEALAVRTNPVSRVVPAKNEDTLPVYELGWIWRNITERN